MTWWETSGGERWLVPALAALRIVLILAAAWLLVAVLQKLVKTARIRIAARLQGEGAATRAETIGRVIRYLVALVVGALALMMVLAEIGISLAPILGAAGVVGLAVGFGAQSLVKDYFTGFFILFEDQIRTGDVVKVADIGGLVEDITLRHVRLRDYDGTVHFIPNSLITTVSNMSRGHAQSVCDIGVAYRENLDEVYTVMRETAAALRADAAYAPRILAPLELAGVERWDDSAVVVRCRFKVVPLAQWDVRREFLKRLKQAFDERGIEIPYPHVTVYAGADRQGRAPSLPVRLDGAPAREG
ncbi:MAG: mechanosensitive ion channel family protein [Rubrivivax sp.]|nr:mechanosensitive ion channel family protein [Rubrivivax sp.]